MPVQPQDRIEVHTMLDLINSPLLPSFTPGEREKEPWREKLGLRAMKRAGVVFRPTSSYDNYRFARVKLPEGWGKILVDSQLGFLLDDKGRRRMEIRLEPSIGFIAHVLGRYSITHLGGKVAAFDREYDEVLFASSADSAEGYSQCVQWLDEHYPKWRDPRQYWTGQHRWWKVWRR